MTDTLTSAPAIIPPKPSSLPTVHLAVSSQRDPFVDLVLSRPASEINPGLWSWQAEALDAWHAAECRGVIEAVTGAGKTLIGITAAFEAFRQGIKVLVLVPTAELQDQWQRRLLETIPQADVGTLGNGRHDSLRDCDVLVAIINSATKRDILQQHSLGLVIADECHRYAARTFSTALDEGFSYRLGLTATYRRPDKEEAAVLDPYFGGVVFRLWYERALQDGVISSFDIAFVGIKLTDAERAEYQTTSSVISKLGMSLKVKLQLTEATFSAFMGVLQSLASRKDDRSPEAMMARKYLEAMNKRISVLTNAKRKLEILDELSSVVGESRGTLVFSQTVDSSTMAAGRLQQSGIETEAVSSESKAHERRGALQRFAHGRAQALCAPRILDEGIDVPDADLAVVLSGSSRPRQTIQRLGRVIRRKADGRHGRFVVLFAVNTTEANHLDVQFENVEPFARRIGRFADDEVRSLRKFLRGPKPTLQAEPESISGSDTLPGTELRAERPRPTAGILETDGHATSHSPEAVTEAGPTPVVTQEREPIVLRKEDDDEPSEHLTEVMDVEDLVKVYLKQIGRYPLLSAEDEIELSKQIEAGLFADFVLSKGEYESRRHRHDLEAVRHDGEVAVDRMVGANLRLVVSIAKRYTGLGMAFLDVIEEGNLGLTRAVQKFDYTKGNKFSTYATWWIRQAITRALADQSKTIRIPVHMHERIFTMRKCQANDAALALCEHDHSAEERALRIQPRSLDAYLAAGRWGLFNEIGHPLDEILDEPGSIVPDPLALVLQEENKAMVRVLLESLPKKNADILRRRFGWINGEIQTLDEIGKIHGLTRERIRQIEKQSMKELRIRLGVDPDIASTSGRPRRKAVLR